MFNILGRGIARHPLLFIFAWIALLAAGAAWSVIMPERAHAEVGSFLPPGSPHNVSSEIIKEALPRAWSNSMMAVIAYRPDGLTAADFDWLDAAAQRAGQAVNAPYLSPKVPFLRPRLVSGDGEAAMIIINLATNFISEGTIAAVDKVEDIIRSNPPPGLTLEITGTAGIGHDYFLATQEAVDRTTLVTVIAVLAILIVVYRSPIGALVPLVSIGASVYLAFVLLRMLAGIGWEVSAMERIFCVVLMFGAGVDFALFWIARYREVLIEATNGAAPTGALSSGNPRSVAADAAMRETGPAILASAATTICGLTTMLTADLVPSRNAGRVLAVALGVALLAALTFAPALARWLGRALFWPMGLRGHSGLGQRVAWPWLATKVTRRPIAVLGGGTALLTALALASFHFPPRFDALQELPPNTSSAHGFNIANAHFKTGQLYPNYLLAVFEAGQAPSDLEAQSEAISSAVAEHAAVTDVYALDRPLGGSAGALLETLVSGLTKTLYLGTTEDERTVLRFEILMGGKKPGDPDYLPFSPETIQAFEEIAARARQAAGASSPPGRAPEIMLSGPTSYIIGVKKVVSADQKRVMLLATAVIALIVLLMVRDLKLTLFMLLATWLTYGATITLSNAFFIHVMGLNGLDWKVRLILFVIVVAVGQDYNIFLVSRLLRPDGSNSREESVRQAITRTGSVISSCGIIMAATLGSLWAGGLSLLRQLGFALALGILIDTFFVRPLLIPSFYLLFGRAAGRARLPGEPATEQAASGPAPG